MGTTNFGTQTINFDYKQQGIAQGFNKLNYKLFPKGIYEGGLLTRADANTVTIGTLTLFIEDSSVALGVRVETAATVNLTITEATPYVIARFIWADVEANYMDLRCVAVGSLLSTDVILGKGNYVGGALQPTFLYTERTISILTQGLGKFYYGTTDPTGTQRLNYDGDLYPTRGYNAILASGGAVDDFHYDAVDPTGTKRLNYEGYFYPTRVYNPMWGDLAEYFPKYKHTKEIPEKVYSINKYGEAELTSKKADKNVLGVCSNTAGFILHEKYKENGVCIGLSGTVKVLVRSKVKKGDFLVSDKNGFAKRATIFNKIFKPEAIIGKALESHFPPELCPTYEKEILMLIK
jgi:hypothetical protein